MSSPVSSCSGGGSQSEGSGGTTHVGVMDVHRNADGSVTISLWGATEVFSYSSANGGWVSNGGSSLMGDQNLFDDTTGWTVVVQVDGDGNRSIWMCHGGDCVAVKQSEGYSP
jgi:hypothetical protein